MYKFVVAGGGTGSMQFVAHALRTGLAKPNEIAVIDRSKIHDYQPGYTMVGGGLMGTPEYIKSYWMQNLRRDLKSVFDKNINHFRQSVTGFSPETNTINLENTDLKYEQLIVCLGLELKFDQVEGLQEALDDPTHPVGSIYTLDYAFKTNKLISQFRGGDAVFCQPNQPFKCGGAPQKIMYLSDHKWTREKIREKTKIDFYVPQTTIFGAPKFAAGLVKQAESKNCNVTYEHLITKVNKEDKTVTFKGPNGEITRNYDFLHVCPPQATSSVLHGSPISNNAGMVEVDQETMRHVKYDNIWSVGDSSSLPTSKTAAAAFVEAPILVENIKKVYNNDKNLYKYEGYTSCPLFVGYNKLMLAEFKYGSVPDETFFSNEDVPRRMFYYLTRYGFDEMYFDFAPKGLWYGRTGFMKPKFELATGNEGKWWFKITQEIKENKTYFLFRKSFS